MNKAASVFRNKCRQNIIVGFKGRKVARDIAITCFSTILSPMWLFLSALGD